MTIDLHPLEWIPIALYMAGILVVGLVGRRGGSDEADFILGGRALTLPAFVATLVTTWYGGILGVGEFTYLYGLSNWVVFGLPYYVFALLFAWLLAPRVRASGLLSIPDQLYHHHGTAGGVLGALFTFCMTLPAPYILMVGLLLQVVTGWPLWFCLVLGTAVSIVYVLTGGFRAVVRTDRLQFVLMFAGFAVLLVTLVATHGGWNFLVANLPPLHLTWHGGNDIDYLLTWGFIALWTFVDPGFHQRCYAAKTERTARRGILVSVGFWLVFDALTTATGLYARALMAAEGSEAALAFPLLGHQALPPLLSGLFLTGLLATIMSTVDSFALLSAITLGHDLAARFLRWPWRVTPVQAGLVVTGGVSVALAITVPSVIQLWLVMGNVFIPPLLLPLAGCYFPWLKIPPGWTVALLAGSFTVAMAWLAMAIAASPDLVNLVYPLGLPPMYPGMAAALLLQAGGMIRAGRLSSR